MTTNSNGTQSAQVHIRGRGGVGLHIYYSRIYGPDSRVETILNIVTNSRRC
jgi:hypothetical protein